MSPRGPVGSGPGPLFIIGQTIPGKALAAPDLALVVAAIINGVCPAFALLLRRSEYRLPPLYESGVRYQEEDGSTFADEVFQDPWTTQAKGVGDCDDLCIARISELQARGIEARATVQWKGDQLHVRVRLPDGSIEDPSVILGNFPFSPSVIAPEFPQ